MKTKKKTFITVLGIWMVIIFGFSNQNITNSISLSDKVSERIIDFEIKITGKKITSEKRTERIKQTRVIVRKTAHFTEYFILGILIYFTFKMYSISKVPLYAILFCFLYACSDELHQLFSDGRSANILDVLIDTSGSILSIGLCFGIKRKSKKME